MWISELSDRTRVPIDTIKHYLRIGVLHRGRPIADRRSEYDETHVERLRLIRAMIEIGGMRLDSVRRVFDSVDESQSSLRQALGQAHYELSRRFVYDDDEPSADSLAAVDRVIARQGWDIWEHSAHRVALATSLDTLGQVDDSVDDALLDFYARKAGEMAAFEISHVDASSSHDAAVRSVVVGTALYEPLVILLRRLAQEHATRDWAAEASWLPTEPVPSEDPLTDAPEGS
jgi:DNA-binding transcriptional MerR regulator